MRSLMLEISEMSYAKHLLAEGEGFEPTEQLAMFNGFQFLRRSCYPVRLVLSCVIQFGLQRVCRIHPFMPDGMGALGRLYPVHFPAYLSRMLSLCHTCRTVGADPDALAAPLAVEHPRLPGDDDPLVEGARFHAGAVPRALVAVYR